MTGGQFDTDVVANRMFLEAFQFFNDGRAAALATILFLGGAAGDVRQPAQPPPAGSRNVTASSEAVQTKAGARVAWRPSMLRSAPLRIGVVLICVLWSLPTFGLLVTSFRPAQAITQTGWWEALLHPFQEGQWTLNNYQQVLNSEGLGNAFVNSLIVSIPSTLIPITIAAFAAYAFAWIKFPFRGLLFAIVVGLLVVPIQMSLVPILQQYSQLGLNGTFLGIWLAHTAFGLPLAIFLLYNYISPAAARPVRVGGD